MEACASAHHWGRELQRRGYHVRLIAAQFVKPYVKSNKNDRVDAEAICEAASRPSMRFVTVKSVAQQDAQAIHRIRSELIKQRTALSNQIRGLVGEYGIVAPVGVLQLRRAIPCWLEEADNGLTDGFRVLLMGMYEDLRHLDERVKALDERIERQAKENPVAARLMTLRGVGPLTATALAGALGDGSAFGKGRDFAASLGLTPRQNSSGGKDRLLGISKRGDPYLRKLLVHGGAGGDPSREGSRGRAEPLGERSGGAKARQRRHGGVGEQDGGGMAWADCPRRRRVRPRAGGGTDRLSRSGTNSTESKRKRPPRLQSTALDGVQVEPVSADPL